MKPRILISDDVFLRIKSGQGSTTHCYGITRLDEGLVQILSLKPQDDLERVGKLCGDGIELERVPCVVPFSGMEAIRVNDDFTVRSRGIIDINVIVNKKVAFVGVGSVGSQIALHLAQSALGHFILLDPDRLSASNLSRHACDLRDLGRFKTKAVRDLILRRNHQADIATFEDDILALPWSDQVERLRGADLVIASTDSTAAQFVVNDVCHGLQISSVYVGAYERACAGEVLFVVPGQTACFNCFMEFRQGSMADLKKKEKRVPYSNESPDEFEGEPGLAVDIAYIVAVASAYALALLLPDSERNKLLDRERNLTLLHSGNAPQGRYGDIFRMPFDLLSARVRRDQECPVCQNGQDCQGATHESPTILS